MDEAVDDLYVIERGAGAREVVLDAEAQAEVLAEEVDVAQLAKESQLGVPGAVGRREGERVQTAAHVESDIVAVLAFLSLYSAGKRQNTDEDKYSFHWD